MLKVTNQQSYKIPEETFIKIPRLTSQDIAEMKPVAREIVSRLTNDQVVEAQAFPRESGGARQRQHAQPADGPGGRAGAVQACHHGEQILR